MLQLNDDSVRGATPIPDHGETLTETIGDCADRSADGHRAHVENSWYADCDRVQCVRIGLS